MASCLPCHVLFPGNFQNITWYLLYEEGWFRTVLVLINIWNTGNTALVNKQLTTRLLRLTSLLFHCRVFQCFTADFHKWTLKPTEQSIWILSWPCWIVSQWQSTSVSFTSSWIYHYGHGKYFEHYLLMSGSYINYNRWNKKFFNLELSVVPPRRPGLDTPTTNMLLGWPSSKA